MLLNLCSMSAGNKGNSIRHIWGLAEQGGFAWLLYNLGGTVLGRVYIWPSVANWLMSHELPIWGCYALGYTHQSYSLYI